MRHPQFARPGNAMIETRQGTQQRTFARAAAAQQGDKLAFADIDIQAIEHATATEAAHQVARLHDWG